MTVELVMDVLPGRYAVHRLAPDEPIPEAVLGERFFSVLRSSRELSVVCREEIPVTAEHSATGWAMLAVRGPLDLGLKGVMARISGALAHAEVAVFVVSSYDTDYVLVPHDDLDRARRALLDADIEVPDG